MTLYLYLPIIFMPSMYFTLLTNSVILEDVFEVKTSYCVWVSWRQALMILSGTKFLKTNKILFYHFFFILRFSSNSWLSVLVTCRTIRTALGQLSTFLNFVNSNCRIKIY